ncbi:F-box protein At5g52880 [Coffea eugenioides]|uniref:F-box protein At5g52880 n=1 Tax=Coffea eugenioides TaxID=49369 RepID=UPI000F6154CB|nr:F-box protein At5g52880 [Coffea eugenioides]
MGCPKERYEELKLHESLTNQSCSRYPLACKELAFILRKAYSKAPKNLQSLLFQDTLDAFRLLPQVQSQNAISAANLLLQNAESTLPKQKKVLAVTEFKHAIVSSKRRNKAQQEEEGPCQFPEDILIHVFSYLDLQSLVSAAMVCRSWSSAACDNHLWESLYVNFFGGSDKYTDTVTGSDICIRENFKRVYQEVSSKKVAPYRGYCWHCSSIVWLTDTRCYNTHIGRDCTNPKVIPVSMAQIVDYVLYDSLPSESSSDSSDTDIDDLCVLKMWAYAK